MRGKGVSIFSSLADVAADGLQLGTPLLQAALDDEGDELFRQLHQVVERGEGDLRLDHPELGEVAARLRFLRAEGRPEAVNLAQRHRRGFDVELARLREVSLLVEVVHREQRGGAFAGGGREDGRIGQGEAAVVEDSRARP